MIYYSIQDYEKALDYYQLALPVFEKESDKIPLTTLFYNMGLVYFDTKNYPEAIHYEEKSLQVAIQIKDYVSEAKACSNLGSIYAAQGDYKKAKYYADRSWILLQQHGDLRDQATSNALLSEIELKQNNFSEAIRLGNLALKSAIEVEDMNLCKDVHHFLYLAHKNLNEDDIALHHLESYSNLVDSLFRSDKQKQIVRQTLNYEFNKKEESIRVEQEKKDIENKAKARVQRIIIYTAIAILLLVIIFSISLYRRFNLTRLQKSIIEEQKKIVEQKNQEVISSITYAQKIQNALLASRKLVQRELVESGLAKEFFLLFRPKDIVSGDFYWATKHRDNFYLAICDSTGHGVPGAFMSLLNSNYLREAIIEKGLLEPHLIFDYVRERLVKGFEQESQKDGMDALLLCFNKSQKTIHFASANNRSILVRKNEIIRLNCDKMPVGKGESNQPFQLFELQVQQNDVLYLFTDGAADQFGGSSGKKLMYKTLNNFLCEHAHESCEAQQTAVANMLTDWQGALEQVDDITLMGIRF